MLERLLTARAVVAVGALAFLIQLTLLTRDGLAWLADWLLAAMVDGVQVMVFAPAPILVIIAALVVIARPGLRLATLKAACRPIAISVGSLALSLGLLTLWPPLNRSGALERMIHGDAVSVPVLGVIPAIVTGVLVIAFCWACLFLFAGAYLVHRNGLAARRELPLLPPLATISVVWLLLIAKVWVGTPDARVTGWQDPARAYGTPAVVTLLATLEILRLRRVHRIGFRGPLRSDAASSPPEHAGVVR